MQEKCSKFKNDQTLWIPFLWRFKFSHCFLIIRNMTIFQWNNKNCAPGVTRTPDTRFRKPLLYPPELQGRSLLSITYEAPVFTKPILVSILCPYFAIFFGIFAQILGNFSTAFCLCWTFKCAYRIVVVISLWPNNSFTVTKSTPFITSWLAKVWRKSWNRVWGKPALLTAA